MLSAAHRAPQCSRICRVAACLAVAAAVGGCGPKSAEERFDEAAKETGFQKATLGKFAGHVRIDGQPPAEEKGKKLFVVLIPTDHLDQALQKNRPPISTACRADGSFDFETYFEHDGVPAGKYVVTFTRLGPISTPGGHFRAGMGGTMRRYGGADSLKGLYSDPDTNMKDDKFVVNVEPPGKTDYSFDLAVAGKENGHPGPHAFKILTDY
jgi:hypothetical protein